MPIPCLNKQGSINFLQKSEDALIPQPLLPSLEEGEPDFKVPLPNLGEGFRMRAGTFARGLMNEPNKGAEFPKEVISDSLTPNLLELNGYFVVQFLHLNE
jgi:hypothetical protein